MFRYIDVQFEPIDKWPGERTKKHRKSQFKAGLTDTYRLLEHEVTLLGCKRLVIQANCNRSMIRNDGLLRSDARMNGPGVIVSFDSKQGPLSYPCDTYEHFGCNLRAIALALQALRAVDRYGVTKRGEQYRGWQALPAPNGDGWRKEDAVRFLRSLLGDDYGLDNELNIRQAELKTHPDRGGNPVDFKKVQRARELLLP
jgi:hypothetical protein